MRAFKIHPLPRPLRVVKEPPSAPRRLRATILTSALLACGGACTNPSAPAEKGAVLLRTYFVALRPDVRLGMNAPPLDKLIFSGVIPAGMDGKTQLPILVRRFTLKTLAFQFSDAAPIELGGDAALKMGFGEVILIRVSNLSRGKDGILTADFAFQFGKREALRQTVPFKSDEALLFAGHVDASLPILSVFCLEIHLYPPDQQNEKEDLLLQPRRDVQAFAPPPPVQRDQEPYLPGVGDVTLPELISSEKAVYPEAAKPEKMEGQVIVEVTVDREGKVSGPRVLVSSNPIFEPPAVEAAKTYRYKPAMKGGKPVSVTMNLIMLFRFTIHSSP